MQNQQHPLQLAVQELQKMPTIDIKGKSYTQVSIRLAVFRKFFPDASISTVIIHDDEQRVVIQAKIKIGDQIISTGFAEEYRGDGWINATSALENAETSSIGRALAGLSLSGNEYASSFEVSNAIAQQNHTQAPSNQQSQNTNTPPSQQGNLEQSIYALGLGIEQLPDGTLSITGNSYPHSSKLKQLKCKWRPQLRSWILPYQQMQEKAA
ncbi:hypothetical protein [Sulfurimonas sp. NW9]|uniref:hypothetical protein n=1 Tax=Sulfurimonas sp. NW9 TaxID=2922728 RepID=UPI003DA9D5D1